ncbi:unnamed protein product [Caenorhabditis bovis]|uniref:Uncharacterized protein n=1 Tax=Caenorhabditis bovis TaxID=2654633 RepID=A0A8S1EHK1_9PELO|nr:unnamed protein product [Caenorhabditis bovis]
MEQFEPFKGPITLKTDHEVFQTPKIEEIEVHDEQESLDDQIRKIAELASSMDAVSRLNIPIIVGDRINEKVEINDLHPANTNKSEISPIPSPISPVATENIRSVKHEASQASNEERKSRNDNIVIEQPIRTSIQDELAKEIRNIQKSVDENSKRLFESESDEEVAESPIIENKEEKIVKMEVEKTVKEQSANAAKNDEPKIAKTEEGSILKRGGKNVGKKEEKTDELWPIPNVRDDIKKQLEEAFKKQNKFSYDENSQNKDEQIVKVERKVDIPKTAENISKQTVVKSIFDSDSDEDTTFHFPPPKMNGNVQTANSIPTKSHISLAKELSSVDKKTVEPKTVGETSPLPPLLGKASTLEIVSQTNSKKIVKKSIFDSDSDDDDSIFASIKNQNAKKKPVEVKFSEASLFSKESTEKKDVFVPKNNTKHNSTPQPNSADFNNTLNNLLQRGPPITKPVQTPTAEDIEEHSDNLLKALKSRPRGPAKRRPGRTSSNSISSTINDEGNHTEDVS